MIVKNIYDGLVEQPASWDLDKTETPDGLSSQQKTKQVYLIQFAFSDSEKGKLWTITLTTIKINNFKK